MDKKCVINADKTWQLWGIPIFGGKRQQLLKMIRENLEGRTAAQRGLFWIITINPEHVMKALENKEYFELLRENGLNVADGVGLVWAKNVGAQCIAPVPKIILAVKVGFGILQGKYKDEVIAGSSLMADLAAMAAENKWKIFYLGGFGNRAERTARHFEDKTPISPLKRGIVTNWSAGEPEISNDEVLKKIKEVGPEILLVAYGMKKQEEWIFKNRAELEKAGVRLVMGVGRSFDYYSGDLKRAPEGWRRMGLEWLYSLIQEPKRLKRQLALPKFGWRVMMGEIKN